MSLHVMSDGYIRRELDKLEHGDRRAVRRLELDIEAMLIGPTCGSEATRLVALMFASSTPGEIAEALADAAERFRRETGQ